MFFKAYLVASTLIAVAAAQDSLTCFQGTPTTAGPATDCTPFVDEFCDSIELINVRVNDSITRCFELPNENVCDLRAYNGFLSDATPSAANCKTVMTSVIANCELGGFGQVFPTGYTFTVDVNHAGCSGLHTGS
ncbi:hypothetical protein AGABI2DRAFT_135726 [Agaricus bisporus var. bisporus H97]|uniref:hypothetical protein n=1 Tax=Agaricus bisporus var. bisporus (strain H97 / ATCC MYA-4626 / FGSC 10389) TaxID=936046 RepID=UPI00029F73BC|nr:hypothetical protein AGABI2DRAFT_135726 [Agaricus bisporus var. bisporus H97]EKV48703.1 hypothetical protein AGABI2DRAFT_135726 [Agaricus bisporus var. bisporus H97]